MRSITSKVEVVTVPDKRTSDRTPRVGRPRRGRPRADEAGQVERRILDAAIVLFRDQGYGRTTVDQVAVLARTGKTTMYARYSTKEELFAAAVRHDSRILSERMAVARPEGSLRQRLVVVGLALAEATLTPESIALMRITAAEAAAFPVIAREGFHLGFGECVRCVAEAVGDEVAQRGGGDAAAFAARFVEMALHPLYMHAFFGADLESLRARAPRDVEQVADALLSRFDIADAGV